jgi:hypothetical protein
LNYGFGVTARGNIRIKSDGLEHLVHSPFGVHSEVFSIRIEQNNRYASHRNGDNDLSH